MEEFCAKILIVGSMASGKSSLLNRFVDTAFTVGGPTAGVEFTVQTVDVRGNHVRLQIWDTAGQERAQSITRGYYRHAAAALIVYDVTDRVSFAQVPRWIHLVREFADNPDIVLILVGAKADLKDNRVISTEEGEMFARERNISFVEVSAKTGEKVDFAFTSLASAIVRKIVQGIFVMVEPRFGVKRGGGKRTDTTGAPDASSLLANNQENNWCFCS